MKSFLPLFSFVIVLGSCTTAYKSGQTPDDVYFSPAKPKAEYVRIEKDEDQQYKGSNNDYSYNDDRYLRMKVRNRNQWSYLDDYYREPFAYSYNRKYYYNDFCCCNPRTYWNDYYNPYTSRTVYVQPKAPVYSRPRTYNLSVFDTPNTTPKLSNTKNRSYSYPRSSEPDRNTGTVLRDVFRGTSDNGSKSSSNTQSTNSSSGSSSSSSSNGSTNAPVRKF